MVHVIQVPVGFEFPVAYVILDGLFKFSVLGLMLI